MEHEADLGLVHEYTQEQADLIYGKVWPHSCFSSGVALQCTVATVQGSLVLPGVFTQEELLVVQRYCIPYVMQPYHTKQTFC